MIGGSDDTTLECKFQACCKYYRENLDTCHDEVESTSHCAAHWQFEEFDKGNQLGTNVANMLIVRISNLQNKSEIIIA
jgi:hypothetical protein